MDNVECGARLVWYWQVKTEVVADKRAPLLFCGHQIPYIGPFFKVWEISVVMKIFVCRMSSVQTPRLLEVSMEVVEKNTDHWLYPELLEPSPHYDVLFR